VDLQLARFVGKMLADDVERDNYEDAVDLAQVLIENVEIKASTTTRWWRLSS